MTPKRLSTTERGLGWDHQRARRQQLPAAYGKVCAFCGEVMQQGQKLNLDHVTPRALGGAGGPTRMVHERCNKRAGAILGNMMKRARRRAATRW